LHFVDIGPSNICFRVIGTKRKRFCWRDRNGFRVRWRRRACEAAVVLDSQLAWNGASWINLMMEGMWYMQAVHEYLIRNKSFPLRASVIALSLCVLPSCEWAVDLAHLAFRLSVIRGDTTMVVLFTSPVLITRTFCCFWEVIALVLCCFLFFFRVSVTLMRGCWVEH